MSLTRPFERTWDDLERRIRHRRHHPHPNPPAPPPPAPSPGPAPAPSSAALARIAVRNRSTTVSAADLAAAVADLQTQVSHDFAPAWLIDARLRVDDGSPLPAGEWLLVIEDDATVRGEFGFHEDVAGQPLGHVFARTARDRGVSWTSVASHELLEMLGDPRTVLAGVQDPTGTGQSGRIVMAEACDAVEQRSYTVGGTEVSDFVLPSWWDETAIGPRDFLGLLSQPFELLPGGSYIGFVDFTSAQGWQQQTAEKAPA